MLDHCDLKERDIVSKENADVHGRYMYMYRVSLVYKLNFIDACENCLEKADVYCEECQNSYCKLCSAIRHRQKIRNHHRIIRLSHLPKPLVTTSQKSSSPSISS